MIDLVLAADVQGPEIDYEGLAPLFALGGGAVIVLMAEPLPRRLRAAGARARAHARGARRRRSG